METTRYPMTTATKATAADQTARIQDWLSPAAMLYATRDESTTSPARTAGRKICSLM